MLRLRPLSTADQQVLWDLLHVALWDPPPAGLRPREILQNPAVRIYAEDWGRAGDLGVLAEDESGEIAGACWMRLIKGGAGLGYVDDETPQLGIALLPKYQHQGHGAPLMLAALDAAEAYGFRQVSLTVHPQNPAIRLYERCGFEKRELRNSYHLMVATL